MGELNLEAIRKRHSRANAGEHWAVSSTNPAYDFKPFSGWLVASCGTSIEDGEDYHVEIKGVRCSDTAQFEMDAKTDAEFLAESWRDVRDLLTEVERLQVALARLKAADPNWQITGAGVDPSLPLFATVREAATP